MFKKFLAHAAPGHTLAELLFDGPARVGMGKPREQTSHLFEHLCGPHRKNLMQLPVGGETPSECWAFSHGYSSGDQKPVIFLFRIFNENIKGSTTFLSGHLGGLGNN